MSNKNCTIKTFFPTFIAAEINKKILTLYSRVESEVGSEEIFVLFRPDDACVTAAVVAIVAAVAAVAAVAVVVVAVAVATVVGITGIMVAAGAADIAVVTDVFVPSSFDVGADVENVDVVVGIFAVVIEVGIVAVTSSEVCN